MPVLVALLIYGFSLVLRRALVKLWDQGDGMGRLLALKP
jgi:hypothetical protein